MGNETLATYYANNIEELRAFFIVRTHDVELSHDLAQDVFVRLLDYKQMITETTLPSLVFVVARRLLADYFRHQQAVRNYQQKATPDTVETVTPHCQCCAADLLRTVETTIAGLPDICQKVYRLQLFDGMKAAEIANTTHIKYKTVERSLGTARRTVREAVRKAI